MTDLWPIISSVFGVLLVMIVGAFCRRVDWLSASADKSLANLTANVLLPAYFIERILGSSDFDSLSTIWSPPIYGFVSTTCGFLIAWAVAVFAGPAIGLATAAKQRAFALCVGVCNYGYIPFPLAEKFYPEAMTELILHNIGVELSLWSVGIAIITGGSGGNWTRALTSPPVLAVAIAGSLKASGVDRWLPTPLLTAIGTMGGCAIPLGLLLSGAIIVDFVRKLNLAGSFRFIAAAILIRQGLLPVLMLVVTGLVAQSTDMKQVMMLQAAMPTAVFPIVLVKLYERDTQTAIDIIVSTSLAGIVLIPLWLAIGGWWLGA